MNKIRAALYALSAGNLLFGLFAAVMTSFSTGETYVAIASLMVFTLAGTALLLFLLLTGTDRRKPTLDRVIWLKDGLILREEPR